MQDDGKFQMRGDPALHAFMIGHGMAAAAEADQDVNEIDRPANKERAHEPMAELDDVIDLKAVLGSIRRQTEKFVDKGEPNHTCPNLPASVPGAARAASGHDARYENQRRRLPPSTDMNCAKQKPDRHRHVLGFFRSWAP